MFKKNSVLNASMHALRFPQKYEAALRFSTSKYNPDKNVHVEKCLQNEWH